MYRLLKSVTSRRKYLPKWRTPETPAIRQGTHVVHWHTFASDMAYSQGGAGENAVKRIMLIVLMLLAAGAIVDASTRLKMSWRNPTYSGQHFSKILYYSTFSDYYGAVYPVVYSPDYLVKEKTVRVETNLYSVQSPNGELMWTGTSDTFNPGSAHKVIKPLVSLIVRELEKQAILPEAPK